MKKNIAVFGIYERRAQVEHALDLLKERGFRNTDVSVLMPHNVGSKDLGTEKATKAPEGAAAGAGSGAVIGGAIGWLASIGTIALPGIGPLLAAGPIVAALAGAGAGGTLGGLTGSLIGLGIPEYEAKRYEGRVTTGGILLSIHADDPDWARSAEEILERSGASGISSTSEARADYAATNRPFRAA